MGVVWLIKKYHFIFKFIFFFHNIYFFFYLERIFNKNTKKKKKTNLKFIWIIKYVLYYYKKLKIAIKLK
jgi:hypothetical protein